jgi:hypothetical protein
MGLVQESNVNGISPGEQFERESVYESHMNGIGPRDRCEWDWSKRAM